MSDNKAFRLWQVWLALFYIEDEPLKPKFITCATQKFQMCANTADTDGL